MFPFDYDDKVEEVAKQFQKGSKKRLLYENKNSKRNC